MYLRHTIRKKDGKVHRYWCLVHSMRIGRRVIQQTVAHLGELDEHGRVEARGLARRLIGTPEQAPLFDDGSEHLTVPVRLKGVRVERSRQFGDVYLALALWRGTGLEDLCERLLPIGKERIAWAKMAAVLVMARLCEPSSELHIAEDWYRRTALADLLQLGDEEVNKDRLYRGLDHLLAHKAALEAHLSKRCGELFAVQNEVLLYDVTSTYFEGEAEANPQAQRGYSRDHRPDCKQVCIALVVTFDGFPLGYEPDGCPAGFHLRIDYSASFDHWAALSEGAYLLRSNISDWSDRQLWKAYIQLTQAEAAFRIQKDQLNVRPIWHQRENRAQAHILVCFLAFVLWKSLRCGSSAPAWEIPREQSSKSLRASSPTTLCCRPRHTAKFAYAASPIPTPPRRLCLTVLASSCPSACALLRPSGKPSLRPPEPGPRPKCSDDFSAKALICPDPTPNSAQVGLVLSCHPARAKRYPYVTPQTVSGRHFVDVVGLSLSRPQFAAPPTPAPDGHGRD